MTKKIASLTILSLFIMCICTFNSCKKDDNENSMDKELYDMATQPNGFGWYKNSEALLDRSEGSGHAQPLLRTRYNVMAGTVLDNNGRIMNSSEFPEGSLIVKELYSNATTLDQYAILYKKSNSADADADGWVWGYMNSNGSVVEPASKKGVSCIDCHTQEGNIDHTLMNKFFP
jgi:hypothetical protein